MPFVSIVFTLVGIALFFLPWVVGLPVFGGSSEDGVAAFAVWFLAAVFFGIGVTLLVLRARGVDPEVMSRIGGLMGALAFGIPSTVVFPLLWLAHQNRPNAFFGAEDAFGPDQYVIGGIFSLLGVLVTCASIALYRYQARTGEPGWSWRKEVDLN